MVCGRDSSARAVRLADGPVLSESRSSLNGWLVCTEARKDIICSTVRGDCALMCATAGWVVRAKGFNNIVLDERASGPTVDREVAVTIGTVVGGIADCTKRNAKGLSEPKR